MVRAEEEDDTMRPCGCHAGRPCTCEMGKRQDSATTFVCGVCVNCRLNAREGTRARKRSLGPRRCLKSAEYFAELAFDRVVLRGNCVFRMRKPDWNVEEKTPTYNKLHQMRLAMTQTRAISLATIDVQKKLRVRYSSDLRKAQDAIKKLESKKMDVATNTRKITTEQLYVDSDVFDSFSKQLIAAETLLPDLKKRLEKANAIISTEQANIKIIREYVRDFAARKLQATTRAYFRFRRWKEVLKAFRVDVCFSAALEIQATWRMFIAKQEKLFLAQLLHDKVKANAAAVLQRFLFKVVAAKRQRKMVSTKEAEAVIAARKLKFFGALFEITGRFVLRDALNTWREGTQEAQARALKKSLASAVVIQRVYRGFRSRIYLKRVKIRSSLTDRVGALVDRFIISGNFWGFVLEIDADYRRFMHIIKEEEADASTFMSTVLHHHKLDEERMMQEWFTASAYENPIVHGIEQVTHAYSSEEDTSSGSSVSHALLHSALVEDLIALSPNKTKEEVFPPDFPPKVIRQAMAKGFSVNEVIAVMRGLQAQRINIEDADLVLSTLQNRSPLMTNPWTSERILLESQSPSKMLTHRIPVQKVNCKVLSKKSTAKRPANSFITENMLESIPGGMNAPVARLLLVAALKCYDPGSRSQKGTFVPCDHSSEMFQSYLHTESPLIKIRREQQAMEAVKPFLHTLIENRCYTAYDILYNVRGVQQLVSWNIPSPLAKSIYSVIQAIYAQSTHISKRNIIRETRIGAEFECFLQTRSLGNLSKPTTAVSDGFVEQISDNEEYQVENSLAQVKVRLESDVLGLPLQDVSIIPASELMFKASFLVDGDVHDPITNNTYDVFLQSLVMLQADGNTGAMRQLVTSRVARAKAVADGYLEIFKLFNIAKASDLLKDTFIQSLIRDPVLQQKVVELLEPFAPANSKQSRQIDHLGTARSKSSEHVGLSPLLQHSQLAINLFSDGTPSTDFIYKSPVLTQEQLPKL